MKHRILSFIAAGSMKRLSFLSTCLGIALLCHAVAAASLPRSTPEEQGVSSSALLAFLQAADENIDAMHSVMLVRHGHVVAEGWWTPYNPESRHTMYSLSKSFTSTAVGMAIAEGRLSLDDSVLAAFPEDAPSEPSAHLKAMRVRDLLAMSTGHHGEDLQRFSFSSSERLTKGFLAMPVAHKPGTHFVYNTPATYMLSAMVQKATGSTVLDYLQSRLFKPLGIEDPVWDADAQGVTLGGYGLHIRTEDIAKFGQLYLQKGQWQGKQLLPAAWVEAATSRQTSNGSNPKSDWEQGYGYQFWRCRYGIYRGDGAFGQYCIVMPEQDAVLAITSGVKDMQAVLNLVWDHLLPAMKSTALSPADDARRKLQNTLANLKVRPQQGSPSSTLAAQVSRRKYVFPQNSRKVEAVMLESATDGGDATLILTIDGAEHRVSCGHSTWKKGRLAYDMFPEQPIAATGAWTTDDTFAAKVCFYEAPNHVTFRLQFSEDQLQLDSEYNVSFGPAKQPKLIGKVQ